MCTLTIHHAPGRVRLTMNRDVLRSRPASTPPAIRPGDAGGPDWLVPLDPPSGGTWIGVNSAGLIAAVLNLYRPGDGPVVLDHTRPARGGIVPAALRQRSLSAAVDWLTGSFDPDRYPPFALVLADRNDSARFEWDEDEAEPLRRIAWSGAWRMTASSGWRTAEVLAWRQRHFEQWLADGAPHDGPLPTFHTLQPPGESGYSPLLDRPDGCTRSITQVDLLAEAATMRHWPEPVLDALRPPSETDLPLRP